MFMRYEMNEVGELIEIGLTEALPDEIQPFEDDVIIDGEIVYVEGFVDDEDIIYVPVG